ncbi:hypothetical protein DSO57_1004304 [Entomophthora muscae]|uniref:Uncharacterized protein n=1 Tax=Entomophthora muscae TaxID=34485 RepID=A0ACC2TVM4_9FUNG|nr:hypothetical protein DSO57_1004304 [Entomophthora muscae]
MVMFRLHQHVYFHIIPYCHGVAASQNNCLFSDIEVSNCPFVDGTVVWRKGTIWPPALKPLRITKLVIDAREAPVFGSHVRIDTLEISGPVPSQMNLANITAHEVTFNKVVQSQTILFDRAVSFGLALVDSNVKVEGINSTELVYFSMSNSLIDAKFPVLETLSQLEIFDSVIDLAATFPALSQIGNVVMQTPRTKNISLPIATVKGGLRINNVEENSAIIFPNLQKVGTYFQVNGPFQVDTLQIPALKHVESIYFSSKITHMQISIDVSWKTPSYFNVKNFCMTYYPAFKERNFPFSPKLQCTKNKYKFGLL